jgi:hypothetical protein
MTRAWWPLGCAVAFLLCAGAGTASAQTFIVRSAPPGNAVEVAFGTAVGKGTVDQAGDATVVLTGSPAETQEVAAAIYTDTCGTTIHVILVGRSADPPGAGANCQRRVVPGYFVFRRQTSVVVDLAPSVPIVRIRQGRVPDTWLMQGPIPTGRTAPRGLVVFGGGGFGTMQETIELTCGNTSPCARENTKLNFMGGASYWLTPWLAAEGALVKPLAFKTTGEGDDYEMVASVNPRILTVSAVGGWSFKAARFYGRVGGAYHRARVETEQATFARTVSVDGVTVTYPASTQTFVYETGGWARVLGAGAEGWVSDSAAVFAEAWFIRVEGENVDANGGERIMKDRLRSLVAGVRVHIGHRR